MEQYFIFWFRKENNSIHVCKVIFLKNCIDLFSLLKLKDQNYFNQDLQQWSRQHSIWNIRFWSSNAANESCKRLHENLKDVEYRKTESKGKNPKWDFQG